MMLDFLVDLGINKAAVKRLEDNNFESILYNLKTNELEIEKILNYFNEIGINNIEELLVNKTELFFKTFREIKSIFSRYDLLQLVNFINYDIDNIDLLFKNN